MADKALNSVTTDSMEEALHRLSKKPGVKAWLMLDRSNGAVLKTNGQVSNVRPARSSSNASLPTPTGGSFSTDVNANTNNETQAAQELASMVWSFLSSAGSLVEEMDSEVRRNEECCIFSTGGKGRGGADPTTIPRRGR
ncbi:hypothetical protein F4809DRAFT_611561 [Biscogniauxia mediterranea]|nr:hypothetical protein F4809DRAFT_611561 [Biscogniauxia mediterranea]